MEFTSTSVSETKRFAADFLFRISKSSKEAATVVGLYGNLGSGKTTFVQCVAEILGVKEHVTSPTFVILKNYKLKTKNYKLLFHVDTYRVKNGEELIKLGFAELLYHPKNLIFIEWPENVKEILPKNHIKLQFDFIDETTRKIFSD